MMRLRSLPITLVLLLPSIAAYTQNLCSTEKVNHEDCTVYVSRRYPVTLPTIQMKPGKKVIVVVNQPLDFETLSLDWTTGTALPGTDQGASLVTSVIPDLKGLYFSNVTLPVTSQTNAFSPNFLQEQDPCLTLTPNEKKEACEDKRKEMEALIQSQAAPSTPSPKDKVRADLIDLRLLITSAQNNFKTSDVYTHLIENVVIVYAQLNQILSPIPKPGFVHNIPDQDYSYLPPSPKAPDVDPWTNYPDWREMMLCELAGIGDDSDDPRKCQSTAPFTNVLGEISTLQGKLPSTTPTQTITVVTPGVKPTPTPPDPDPSQLFDQKYFDYLVKQTRVDIKALYPTYTPDELKITQESNELQQLQTAENLLTSKIAALSNTLTNVQKDFVTYYQNILLVTAQSLPASTPPNSRTIGYIYDPAIFQHGNTPVSHSRLLGRQVVYSVNAVNQISTPLASITATTAKTSVATVTVLFADPIFETSAGGLISFVHNRTFANQTVITPQPGTLQMPGDIIISETKTDPEVVPFVAGHWRLIPEFTMPDKRRGALYATAWVGLNTYTSLPEYGAGATLSWRSFMFSALYNRAHEVVLTGTQTVGQIVCSPSAVVGATPPPCTPAPPAPITKTISINAFAIGISIRLPTTFTAGTGGVSH